MGQAGSLSGRARQLVARALAILVVGFAVFAASAGCAGSNVRFVPPPPAAEDNTLGVSDVFAVRVFGEQDMSQEYRIAPDGTIDFPYLGRIWVQGMEPSQIADTLRDRLREREILRDPQVSVYVRELNSRRVSILGQVQRPGTFPYEQNMTIIQAITAAGGFTPLAEQTLVRLTRNVRGSGRRSYTIPVNLIAEGRIANVNVAPGDVIFVPERVL
jgi:polysaccharide export outer membrane protein